MRFSVMVAFSGSEWRCARSIAVRRSADYFGTACRCRKQRDVAKEHMKLAPGSGTHCEQRIPHRVALQQNAGGEGCAWCAPSLVNCAQLFACAPEYYRKAYDREDVRASFRLIGATQPELALIKHTNWASQGTCSIISSSCPFGAER